MPLLDSARNASAHGWSAGQRHTTNKMSSKQRRPSFADALNTEAERSARETPSATASPNSTPTPPPRRQLSDANHASVSLEVEGAAAGTLVGATCTSATDALPGRRCRMFIELEQYRAGVWSETHHWNWAFEQEATNDSGGWSLPHLPTISAKALVALYKGLGEHNVLLDVQGTTFPEVANSSERAEQPGTARPTSHSLPCSWAWPSSSTTL